MNDVMIDLETVGQEVDAGMCTIAAIKFDRHGDITQLIEGPPQTAEDIMAVTDYYYARVKIKTLVEEGFTINDSTLEWWERQTEAARYEAFEAKPRLPVFQALGGLYDFIDEKNIVWSHGATFDIVLLTTAFNRMNLETPWKFWNARCTRTLYDLADIGREDQRAMRCGQAHHALFDCWDQIVMAQEAYRRMR